MGYNINDAHRKAIEGTSSTRKCACASPYQRPWNSIRISELITTFVKNRVCC
jgi:hypothetical protein